MRVSVDVGMCIAAGQCVAHAADVFDQDDDSGLVVLLNASPDAEARDRVEQAASVCPAQAIAVAD